MSLFRKFFGVGSEASDEESQSEFNAQNQPNTPVDERFMYNFKKNGGKFLYCTDPAEVSEQFENILEENDWFESEVLCYEPKLHSLLEDNKLNYQSPAQPKFLFATCENLIADEGSILFSSNQIKQNKPDALPVNIVIYATTSQILESKSDGLRTIKKKYDKDYPTNITTIKYFEKAKEEDLKIKTVILYLDSRPFDRIKYSKTERKNGEIYMTHENINTVRKVMAAFENKDFDKYSLYYDESLKVFDINNADFNKSTSLKELIANDKNFHQNFEIVRIEQVGYPDYLHFELMDARVVNSWWNVVLIRKSDKKKMSLPLMLSNDFNAKGKIIAETMYYSQKTLEAK